jgi:thioredoxin-related protein
MGLLKGILVLGACLAALDSTPARAAWLESFESAKSQALSQRRPILMYFSGSDWCPSCQQFKAAVLDSPEFNSFAESRLVLFQADFPRYRSLAQLHLQANRQLATQYRVTGYPTILLAAPNGKVVANIAAHTNPSKFVDSMAPFFSPAQPNNPNARPTGPGEMPVAPPRPVQDLPLFGGAATHPPMTYTNLVLKSISGPPARRYALINSETMSAGDTVRLTLGNTRLNLECLEVRAKSVLVRVQGETVVRELKLNPPAVASFH